MGSDGGAAYRYDQTIRMFAAGPEPAFESPESQTEVWGRPWGCDNDVGRLRLVLMHRPGAEMSVVDPARRIEELGTYGDPEHGWYWQSDEIAPLAELQAQHDALVAALRAEGVEVVFLEGVGPDRMKSCYTRDSAFAVKGGAIVGRLGTRIRRGEEQTATRTLANLGMPILRSVHATGLMEGGSFAWLNPRTAVVGRSIRVNEEGARQVAEVLAAQGVDLLRVDLCGYNLHIDGALLMLDVDVAMVRPEDLPYAFLETLRGLGIRTVELAPDDDSWVINGLAVRPGRVLMHEGLSARTRKALDALKIEVVPIPYDRMALNGGGIHCSTCPLIRDPID